MHTNLFTNALLHKLPSLGQETFLAIVNEATFAMYFHSVGAKLSKSCLFWADGDEQGIVPDAEEKHKRAREEIRASELYRCLRIELRRRFPKSSDRFSNDWVGWGNLSAGEVRRIKSAIETYIQGIYVSDDSAKPTTSVEEMEASRNVFRINWIVGIFVDWETPYRSVHLELTFLDQLK